MTEQAANKPQDIPVSTEPSIEFFILADRAEAVNGKLYMMGGAWDRYAIQNFANPIPISFALGILVPWLATNRQYTLAITIENLERQPVPNFNLTAGFVAGRPAHITQGETQRVTLAIPTVFFQVKEPGEYQAVARLSSGAESRVPFHLIQAAALTVPRIS